jgi:hypothetical protein
MRCMWSPLWSLQVQDERSKASNNARIRHRAPADTAFVPVVDST